MQEISLIFYILELLFDMENNISDKVKILLESKLPEDTQIRNFIRANESYEKLIRDGLAVKRGFNIMTKEEIYNPALNSSSYQSPQRYNS